MPPDFSSKTVETLARRAAFLCSNPDCQKSTVGPNSEPSKSLMIGEAAHIQGARPDSKRYLPEMNDHSRAEITNGIWLCRNCHKLVDSDENQYPAELLFKWRENQENYAASTLGKRADALRIQITRDAIANFEGLPSIVQRILMDKPEAWEWRLTAELMRYHNEPIFKRYAALNQGLYTRQVEYVAADHVFSWAQEKMADMSTMVRPLAALLEKINDDWGSQGEPGDANAIIETCELIGAALKRILEFEETIHFAHLPESNGRLQNLLKNALGSQIEKFRKLPDDLDRMVAMLGTNHGGTKEKPTVIESILVFELPDGWDRKIRKELKRANPDYDGVRSFGETVSGVFWLCVFGFVIYVIFF